MRILHVTPDYHPAKGGGEVFIKEVSERLAARGHQVTVLAMNSRGMRREDGARLPRREAINGVQVRHSVSHQFTKKVDPYKKPGDPKSGVLPGIQTEKLAAEATGMALVAMMFTVIRAGSLGAVPSKARKVKLSCPTKFVGGT